MPYSLEEGFILAQRTSPNNATTVKSTAPQIVYLPNRPNRLKWCVPCCYTLAPEATDSEGLRWEDQGQVHSELCMGKNILLNNNNSYTITVKLSHNYIKKKKEQNKPNEIYVNIKNRSLNQRDGTLMNGMAAGG